MVYIGIFAALAALLAGVTANALDQGILRFFALSAVYVFGINAVLLLGYEAQERASLVLKRG